MKEIGQLRHGITLFNTQKFFEAHEVWEELWLVEPEPEKTFLQGLIQVAAAFHHRSRGNERGMQSLLTAGTAKLGGFPAVHRGVALAELCVEAERYGAMFADGEAKLQPKPPKIRMVGGDRGQIKRGR